jgi:hypothetical protein
MVEGTSVGRDITVYKKRRGNPASFFKLAGTNSRSPKFTGVGSNTARHQMAHIVVCPKAGGGSKMEYKKDNQSILACCLSLPFSRLLMLTKF